MYIRLTPQKRQPTNPRRRGDFPKDDIAGNFEQDVRDEEDLQGDVEHIALEMQLVDDAQDGDVAQVDAVQEAKGEDDPERRHQMEVDLAEESLLHS